MHDSGVILEKLKKMKICWKMIAKTSNLANALCIISTGYPKFNFAWKDNSRIIFFFNLQEDG